MRSLILILLLPITMLAQQKGELTKRNNSVSVFAGMGISLVSASDLVEYINATAIPSQRIDDFGTAVDFFGGCEFPVSSDWGVKIEHSYLFKSYSFLASTAAVHDLFYSIHSPMVMIQKVISGKGYFLKVAAGGGYHIGTITQKISTFGVETEYTANGVGLKADIVGQTAFDHNFYGYIGAHIGWGFLGKVKNKNGSVLSNTFRSKQASLDHFSAGLRFGAMYYF